jgi:hypothetical protein
MTIVILTSAFMGRQRERFEEIDVERINVVEKNGAIRMVIANRERTPGPVERGVPFGYAAGQRLGMIFYNDEGTENGGLTYYGSTKEDHASAYAGLTFDQYDRDQTIALQYVEDGGRRRSGLAIQDYPTTTTNRKWAERYDEIQAMTDSAEKREAMARWREDRGRGRLFAGRQFDGASVMALSDGRGRTRIRLKVDSLGTAAIEFLDDTGNVTRTIGPRD